MSRAPIIPDSQAPSGLLDKKTAPGAVFVMVQADVLRCDGFSTGFAAGKSKHTQQGRSYEEQCCGDGNRSHTLSSVHEEPHPVSGDGSGGEERRAAQIKWYFPYVEAISIQSVNCKIY